MKRAAVSVTDQGGQNLSCRHCQSELGVPCIVGTGQATKKLKNNQLITVDAVNGHVYLGEVKVKRSAIKLPKGIKKIRRFKNQN